MRPVHQLAQAKREAKMRDCSTDCLERSERLRSETGPPIASSEARGYEDEICPPVFEILAIRLRVGPDRLGPKIPPKIPPSRADLGQKFTRAQPTWAENSSGPTWAENSPGPGRSPKNKFDVKLPQISEKHP